MMTMRTNGNVYQYLDYQRYLRSLINIRKDVDGSYSLRKMAKELCLSHSTLCEVLKEKKHFSLKRAAEISTKLNHTAEETQYFVLLVEFKKIRLLSEKEKVLNRLRERTPREFLY